MHGTYQLLPTIDLYQPALSNMHLLIQALRECAIELENRYINLAGKTTNIKEIYNHWQITQVNMKLQS